MAEEKVTLQGVLIAILCVGLFFGVFALFLDNMSIGYSLDNYVTEDLTQLDNTQNMSVMLQNVKDQSTAAAVDQNAFDVIGNLISKALAPIKFIYDSIGYVYNMGGVLISVLKLPPIFTQFIFATLIVILVVGIFFIKFAMGREK